jgi:hypothetical protein
MLARILPDIHVGGQPLLLQRLRQPHDRGRIPRPGPPQSRGEDLTGAAARSRAGGYGEMTRLVNGAVPT